MENNFKRWISINEQIPEPKQWCWVWIEIEEGNGSCEKMYLSSEGNWMKSSLQMIKEEFNDCIKAWQPYYEPEPYNK